MACALAYSFCMDQNPADFAVQKEAKLRELLDIMIKALETGTMSAVDSEEASKFISDQFDNADDMHYIQSAVETLCDDWPIFKPALLSFKTQQAQHEDAEKIAQTEQKIEELRNIAQ